MLTRFRAEPASKADHAQKTLPDVNHELVPFLHGQHWTPVAGQSSTPVYRAVELFEPTRVSDTAYRRSPTHAATGRSSSPEAVASEGKCLVQSQAKFVNALRFRQEADVSAVSRKQQNDAIAGAMVAGEFTTVGHAEVGDQKVDAP